MVLRVESETDEREGWTGYVWEHYGIGRSENAYESADDCAVAGMDELVKHLAAMREAIIVPRDIAEAALHLAKISERISTSDRNNIIEKLEEALS